jgi:hypothetical protein
VEVGELILAPLLLQSFKDLQVLLGDVLESAYFLALPILQDVFL